MRITKEAVEVDDQPQRPVSGLTAPAAVARTLGSLADLGRSSLQLVALGLVLGGSSAITIVADAALRVGGIAAVGLGAYLLGQLHAARRPGERDIAVERAVLARREADLNRVLVSFALLGRDGATRPIEQVEARSAGAQPRSLSVVGGPPRRLSLDDLDASDRLELGLDAPLEGESDADTAGEAGG